MQTISPDPTHTHTDPSELTPTPHPTLSHIHSHTVPVADTNTNDTDANLDQEEADSHLPGGSISCPYRPFAAACDVLCRVCIHADVHDDRDGLIASRDALQREVALLHARNQELEKELAALRGSIIPSDSSNTAMGGSEQRREQCEAEVLVSTDPDFEPVDPAFLTTVEAADAEYKRAMAALDAYIHKIEPTLHSVHDISRAVWDSRTNGSRTYFHEHAAWFTVRALLGYAETAAYVKWTLEHPELVEAWRGQWVYVTGGVVSSVSYDCEFNAVRWLERNLGNGVYAARVICVGEAVGWPSLIWIPYPESDLL